MRHLTASIVLVLSILLGCKKTPQKTTNEESVSVTSQSNHKLTSASSVTEKDMEDIRLFIDTVSTTSGQMPTPTQVSVAISDSGSPVAEMIRRNLIVLNPAHSREEVWAYEAKALQSSGWVVTASGVNQMTAPELKRRLGR